MKFIVHYAGGTGRLPSWTKEYTELDSIELFFKKYFEEMLAEEQFTREIGPHRLEVDRSDL